MSDKLSSSEQASCKNATRQRLEEYVPRKVYTCNRCYYSANTKANLIRHRTALHNL